MSVVVEPPAEAPEELAAAAATAAAGEPVEAAPADAAVAAAEETPPASPLLTIVAVALSAAGGAWMTGGIFRDGLARGVGILGVLIAVALLLLATRLQRPALLQGIAIPIAAAIAGGALVLPQAGAGSSSIPALVGDAVHNGGILQPPIPFDPGWRFILVVLFAVATAAGASLALSLNRPRLGVLVPLPVTILTAIVQPDSAVLVSALGAMALVAGAMAVAYGAELSRTGGMSLQFERNRLLRGAGLIAVLAVVLGVISRSGLLFPNTERNYVAPPQKPQVPPSVVDHTLFTVAFSGPGHITTPLRVGVLDDYDASQQAWLLPAYDTHRFEDLTPPSPIPGARAGAAVVATITISDGGGSHTIPTIPGASGVAGGGSDILQFDPETQNLQLRDHPALNGYEYAVTAPVPPTAAQLRDAAPPPSSLRPFLDVPRAPVAITALLAQAPAGAFDRLQYVRQQLYAKVTAAGSGQPVDISVDRVVQILNGGTATPYELTAAEALLARYAGVPSRIGYGYIGGHATPSGALAVHPDNGAAWLEAYFTGYGWVDIVGTPPRAQSSIDQSSHPDPSIHPSDLLSLVVYVPVRVHTALALYEVARYWLGLTLPVVVVLALLAALLPLAAKRLRRRRRNGWAMRHGPRARTGVAYAELRDAAADLGIGSATATPFAFLHDVEPDDEHAELAWLVTRALWGDLRRDLRVEDASSAESMARSVARRLSRGQPLVTRILATMSRASLRRPYSDEVPNLWFPQRAGPARRRRFRLRGRRGGLIRAGGRPALAGATLLAVFTVVSLLASSVQAKGTPAPAPANDPTLSALVPSSIGGLNVQRERAAESAYQQAGPDAVVSAGQVYTVNQGPAVQASIQVSLLKPGLSPQDEEFVNGLRTTIASATFQPLTVHVPLFDGHCRCVGAFHDVEADQLAAHYYQRIFVALLPDQRIYFWFPPGNHTLLILVVRDAVGSVAADALAISLSDFEHGAPLDTVPVPPLQLGSAASSPAAATQP